MGNQNPLISVIIPVYNAETYLRRCLLSLKEQDYENIEVVMVDDCSTDTSKEICEDFAKTDSRFKLLSMSKNSGAGDTRNKGICFAHGDFIAFVDSDDYVEPAIYTFLLDKILTTGADIATCQAYDCTPSGKKLQYPVNSDFVVTSKEALIYFGKNRYIGFALWNKLYKRDIVKGVEMRTMPSEDAYALFEYLKKANKISISGKPLYNYVIRENSLSSSVSFIDDYQFHIMMASYLRKTYGVSLKSIFKRGMSFVHQVMFIEDKEKRDKFLLPVINSMQSLAAFRLNIKCRLILKILHCCPNIYFAYKKMVYRIFNQKLYKGNKEKAARMQAA